MSRFKSNPIFLEGEIAASRVKVKREQVVLHVILQVQTLSSSDNEAVTSSLSFWPAGVHFKLEDHPVALEIRILHSPFILSLSKDKTY